MSGGSVGPKEQYAVAWNHIIHQNEYREMLVRFYTTLTFGSLAAVAWLARPASGAASALDWPWKSIVITLTVVVACIGMIVILFVAKAWEVRDRFLAASALLAGGPAGKDIVGYAITGHKSGSSGFHSESTLLGGYALTVYILSMEAASLGAAAIYLWSASVLSAILALLALLVILALIGHLYYCFLQRRWPTLLQEVKCIEPTTSDMNDEQRESVRQNK